MMDLRVEYFYDDESHNWGFVVPSLHIVGSGETREDAEREARDAIFFTLEGDDEPMPEGHELSCFRVSLDRAS